MRVRLEPWGEGDLPLLEKTVGDPEMMVYLGGAESAEKMAERQVKFENAICRKLGFTLLGAHEFEYPPGNPMQCNDWRLDLLAY